MLQVFGVDPDHEATAKLPQHGFARTSRWEFLGKSTSESSESKDGGDSSVKLDFGLSSSNLSEESKKAWPFSFGLIYSVTLGRDGLATSMVVRNEGESAWDFQILMHSYLRVAVSFLPFFRVSGYLGSSWTNHFIRRTSRTFPSPVSNPPHTSTKSLLQLAPLPRQIPRSQSPTKPTVSTPPLEAHQHQLQCTKDPRKHSTSSETTSTKWLSGTHGSTARALETLLQLMDTRT